MINNGNLHILLIHEDKALTNILDLLIYHKLCKSNAEAKRLIQQEEVYFNTELVTDYFKPIQLNNGTLLEQDILKVGLIQYLIFVITEEEYKKLSEQESEQESD
jgi:tyrosyl-tRNA synthetase